MPASFHIDPSRGMVFSYATGAVSFQDFSDHQQALIRDSAFHPGLAQLADARTVTAVSLTVDEMRILARNSPFGAGARRAFVVAKDAHFGLARMFELMTEDHPDELRVFRSMAEARAWLNLPPETTDP